MPQRVLGIALLCGWIGLPQSAAAHADAGKPVAISIKICEAAADGARQKVLAAPTIVTTVGRSFSFHAGGTFSPKTGEEKMEIGTRVTGTLRRSDGAAMQAGLKITLATCKDGDAVTDLVLAESLEVRTLLTPGQTKRLDCGGSRWCEIRLDETGTPALGEKRSDLEEGDILTVAFSKGDRHAAQGSLPAVVASPAFRLAARVVKARPDGVCEIKGDSELRCNDKLAHIYLSGSVRSASVSDKREVSSDAITDLRVLVRED